MAEYRGAILESWYSLNIPTNPEELAGLLDNYALDWGIVLSFMSKLAHQQGIIIDTTAVVGILRQKYGEE